MIGVGRVLNGPIQEEKEITVSESPKYLEVLFIIFHSKQWKHSLIVEITDPLFLPPLEKVRNFTLQKDRRVPWLVRIFIFYEFPITAMRNNIIFFEKSYTLMPLSFSNFQKTNQSYLKQKIVREIKMNDDDDSTKLWIFTRMLVVFVAKKP